MTERGFIKADSNNMPKIDGFMVANFFVGNDKYSGAELRGVKNARVSRDNYGDSAVGYVQLKREGVMCVIKARMTPEHKVRSKGYSVHAVVNEKEGKVVSVDCEDCPASQGGCKHSIAFLMFLHRRSEDPPVTSVTCYWKKSRLSKVGSTLKFIKCKDLSPPKAACNEPTIITQQGDFLKEFLTKANEADTNSQICQHFKQPNAIDRLSIHNLMFKFIENGGGSGDDFLTFCNDNLTDISCTEVEKMTQAQSKNSDWFKVRYGRVTASKLHEAVHCKTLGGSLVETILGGKKIPESFAMKRGKDLEKQVLRAVGQKENIKFKNAGLFIQKQIVIIGASPDAVTDTLVIEVKCPSSKKTMSHYVSKDGNISKKCLAQVQIQMHLAQKPAALFCVAHPDFEVTNEVDVYRVGYSAAYCESMVEKAVDFWKRFIFPILIQKSKQ